MKIRIGTRKSPLALVQAEEVRSKLLESRPDCEVELVAMSTSGDNFTDRPLSEIGGKGLFTKEIEEAMLAGRIDIAVHSVKDMQTVLPDGLSLGCVLEREDPRDRLIGENLHSLDDLPNGARFGTSSLRRSAQLLMLRPDLKMVPLRGNVQTRLKKLQEGEMDATMLAVAGLNRLQKWDTSGVSLSTDEFLPAIGQGAIGIECRTNDTAVLELLSPLADIASETAVVCERAFLQALDGSCHTPIAAYATVDGTQLRIRGLIMRPDGSAHHRVEMTGNSADAESLGIAAGEELLAKAGANFLD
jgi:hydroxymethylbilane synthase